MSTIAAVSATTAFAADEPLDTVTVWAQKRASALQNVPLAMSTLNASELSDAGIDDADDLAVRLTSLELQRTAGSPTTSLRIRRIGHIGNIPTFEPSVGVFVDGAYRSRSFLGTTDLLMTERIEVLKGPQSTLYGKNVSAGVLAIYTRNPAERFESSADLTAAIIDSPRKATQIKAGAEVGGPLAPSLIGSLAVRWTTADHTMMNVLPGPDGDEQDRLAARGQILWSPNDALMVRLLAGHSRERADQGESEVYLAGNAGSTSLATLLQSLDLTATCADNTPHNRKVCSVATNTLDFETTDLTLLGELRLANGWNLTSISAWDRYEGVRNEDDAIQLFAPIFFYRDAERGESIQEELRLASRDDGALHWLLGAFVYQNEYQRGDHGRTPMFGPNGALASNPIWPVVLGIPLATPNQQGLHESELDTRYVSVFAQSTWRLTDVFAITGGLRWQEEDKQATINNQVTAPGASLISLILTPPVTATGLPVNGTLRRSSSDVVWSITPEYRLGGDVLTYLTVSTGVKSGGFNTGFGDAPLAAREFDDETVRHYEIGARARLEGARASLSGAAFATEYRNYQDAAFVGAQFLVGNAERVRVEGVELDADFALLPHVTAEISASYVDSHYAKNTLGMCYPGRIPDGSRPGTCNLRGAQLPQAPEWSTHVGLQYSVPARWGEHYARVDWSWTGEYNTSYSADPRLVQTPHSKVALRIGSRFGEKSELTLWVDNLLNETVSHVDAVLNLFNDESYQSYMDLPRSYGATLRIRF